MIVQTRTAGNELVGTDFDLIGFYSARLVSVPTISVDREIRHAKSVGFGWAPVLRLLCLPRQQGIRPRNPSSKTVWGWHVCMVHGNADRTMLVYD